MPSSIPILARAILGLFIPNTLLAYILLIPANWTKFIGLQSALAPLSAIRVIPLFTFGIAGHKHGLSIPLILPTTNTPPASTAPVFPADINACALPSLTSLSPTTIDESFLLLIAFTGLSSFSITSVVCTISNLLLSNS